MDFAQAVPSSLGPGRGAWVLESPEMFGLTSAQLDIAAERMKLAAPVRYCFLMAKDGHLIYEKYFHNASETRYEADSLAKTMIAQVVGVAVAKGLLELDKPIAEYGVKPRCYASDLETSSISRPLRPARRRLPYEPRAHCRELLRSLCPHVAPPFDCHTQSDYRPQRPPSSLCTSGCLQDELVKSRVVEANCTNDAVIWCNSPPGADGCWRDCITNDSYYPRVTTRHLLTQTTGAGLYEPGEAFTYDSDKYIDHLAYLVSKVTNESSATWATREYALPMGLPPDLFAYDGFVDPDDGPEFSPGGGQMMSCRDHLRVSQLLINKGRWADDDGLFQAPPGTRKWRQLLTEDFVEQFLAPSFPAVSVGYGFLVWLNRPASIQTCCAPRWGETVLQGCDVSRSDRKEWERSCVVHTCRSSTIEGHIIGDGLTSESAPADLALGMGQSAKYSMTIPSQGLAVVSLGLSWGSSSQCPLGKVDAGGSMMGNGTRLPRGTLVNASGYDDAFTATQVWRAFGNITQLMRDDADLGSGADPVFVVEAHRGTSKWSSYTWPSDGRNGLGGDAAPTSVSTHNGDGGACYCYCPPSMGFGVCFNMNLGTTPGDCSSAIPKAADYCPAHGQPRQCSPHPSPSDTDCEDVHLDGLNCTLSSACADMPEGGSHGLPPSDLALKYATCLCRPSSFSSCYWTSTVCEYTPYFPPASPSALIV